MRKQYALALQAKRYICGYSPLGGMAFAYAIMLVLGATFDEARTYYRTFIEDMELLDRAYVMTCLLTGRHVPTNVPQPTVLCTGRTI